MSRRDLPWLGLVALSLAAGIGSNWRRLGDALVDCGREMDEPLRLLRGERLYADVQHFYGPLSPHLNALLLRVFGVHLDVLRTSGAAAAVAIVVLVYWLTRRLAGPMTAAAAALAVTWLCALAPNGNFVLPYSYAAVHGCALAFAAVAAGVAAFGSDRVGLRVVSGACAGLALAAKTEMGAAALAGGLAAAVLGGPLRPPLLRRRVLAFSLPAVVLPAIVYGWVAAGVGTRALIENHVVPLQLPAPTVRFLRWVYGLEHPFQALARQAVALLLLAIAFSLVLLSAPGAARPSSPRARLLLRCGSLVLLLLVLVAMNRSFPSVDPMAAMPLLAAVVVLRTLLRAARQWRRRARVGGRTALALVCALFALACLGRSLLYVRTNSYGTFMLPAALMVAAWVATWELPLLLRRPAAVRWARRLGAVLLLAWTGTGVVATYRATAGRVYRVSTPRGTMSMGRPRAEAFAGAIRFVERETRPGEPVAVLPEGTSILFLADRRNPLTEELATPGLLNEARAVSQLESSGTRLILLTDRPTDEFGAHAFGRDYAQGTMAWIEARYRVCGTFGLDPRPDREIGSGRFFIKAYCRS